MVVDLYERQLLNASQFVKVFRRENPSDEVEMPEFSGRGHFQCECEGTPGLTMHGYYNTVVVTAYNIPNGQYEPMWGMVLNRRDTWWEERSLDVDLKRYVCQQAPSFFKLSSYEEHYLPWASFADVKMYVRMLGNRHLNDVVYLDSLWDPDEWNVYDYEMKMFVWMSKMPGVYVDPTEWNPLYDRPRLNNVRSYNQSRFEEMVYAYQILESQGDVGPILTPLKEEENVGGQETVTSEVDSAVASNAGILEEALSSDIFTSSAIWNSSSTLDAFSSDFEPGEYEPGV